MESLTLLIIVVSVVSGALIKGLAGFGFGILGTTLLMSFLPARDAITVMILPLLAVNIPLVLEADFSHLKSCLEKYSYFTLLGLSGAFLGVYLVDILPADILSLFVGSLALLYAYFKQRWIWKPTEKILSKCFTDKWYNQSWIGLGSGLIYGSSNIGLPYVVYLDRVDVDRRTFVGLLSIILLFATAIRASFSYYSGLYTEDLLLISAIVAVLGFMVSEVGAKISHKVPNPVLEDLTILFILVASIRIIIVNL